jgi:methylenetetrahydrofolate reductase (NADPH)
MTFIDKLRASVPTLSCEFFPPKNFDGWSTLYQTMGRIARLAPDFFSVTYGAGGSTREKTLNLVERIESELGIEAVAHLTCVGHSVAELHQILGALRASGVHSIMALRGDPPQDTDRFSPHPSGFSHAYELITIARADPDLRIGCAFYPEKHSETSTLADDIRYLKIKQDAGADFAVSQVCFDNEAFLRFRDLARAEGVTLPLIAGILPVGSRKQLDRITSMCAASVPKSMRDLIEAAPGDDLRDEGIAYATSQRAELIENGIDGIHLYTFNQSNASVRVMENLRQRGLFGR